MENQQKFLKGPNIKWKVGGKLFGFGTSPEADWKIIFTSTAILIIVIVAASVFMFVEINMGKIFLAEESPDQKEEILDISLLKETVSYYQNKTLELDKIKGGKMLIVDPSL